MTRRTKLAIALTLALAVACAGMAMAAPIQQWVETSGSGAGNVYYGSVVGDTYYTAQIDSGVLQYDSVQTAGTAKLNSFIYGVTAGSKSATAVGNDVYFAANGAKQLVGWTTVNSMTASAGAPESITTDGTSLFSNDYGTTNKTPIRKYSISGTSLTESWATTIAGAARVRGLSYYAGGDLIYAVDGANGVWEMNASDGSGLTKIISWSGIGTGYQAVRSGSSMFVVADNGNLYQYGLSGGIWSLADTNNLGLGALYGIGINSTGTGFWVSSSGFRVAYYAVPEPASILALASGFIGLAGFSIRRRRA